MRHFLLLSIALSTLAVLAAAGKKLEELSPAAREFLTKREYFDYARKCKEISYRNLNLPRNGQISYPKPPASVGANAKTAYNKLYRQHAHKKDAFDHANIKAYQELFYGGSFSTMTTQLRRMDEIEGWRQKAFTFSRTDRLGRLITKTFDLIQTVVRDGPNAEILVHEVECLHTEQTNAIMAELNIDDAHRSLLYGLSASLGIMIESINERNLQMAVSDKEDSPVSSGERHSGNIASEDDELTVLDVIGPKTHPWMHKPEPEIKYLRTKSKALPKSRSVTFGSRVVVHKPSEANDQSRQKKDCPTRDKSIKRSVVANSGNTAVHAEKNSEPLCKRSRLVLTQNVSDQTTSKSAATAVVAAVAADARKAAASKTLATTPKARKSESESLPFGCNQCYKKFNSAKNLSCHKNTVHRGIQCGDCGVRIKNHENLCKHYAERHPERSPFAREDDDEKGWSLQCAHCDFRAEYHSKLKQHLRKHTGVFTCSRCPSTFPKEYSLKKHVREEHAKKMECDTCGNEFRSRHELYNHCQEEHSVKRMIQA